MDLALLLKQIGPPGRQRGRSRQQRLYGLLRQAILDGTLVCGARLPASRTVAAALGIARNSVIFAYEQLNAEGFLVSDRRATRVAALVGSAAPALPSATASAHYAGLSERSQQLPSTSQENHHLPFAAGMPDLHLFPRQRWARHLQRAWNEVGARHLAYSVAGGEPRLREAIAAELRLRRGLACKAEQVFVTSGVQMAVEFCARLLADPGDIAWMESPGYPLVRTALHGAGLSVVDVPVDRDGLCFDDDLWPPPRLVFVSPSHQYPTGAVMSLERRLALLALARSQRAWLIEDDYDSELCYSGSQLPALQALGPDAPVVYVGTFSKSLYPGLRIGYVVVPAWSCAAIAGRLHHLHRPGRATEQLALASFIESGDLARHLRQMRAIYQARQACMRQTLIAHFGDDIAILGGAAGIHLTIVFNRNIDDRALAARAAALGVTAEPLSGFYAPGAQGAHATRSGLLLGYGVSDEKLIRDLVPRLKQAYDDTVA